MLPYSKLYCFCNGHKILGVCLRCYRIQNYIVSSMVTSFLVVAWGVTVLKIILFLWWSQGFWWLLEVLPYSKLYCFFNGHKFFGGCLRCYRIKNYIASLMVTSFLVVAWGVTYSKLYCFFNGHKIFGGFLRCYRIQNYIVSAMFTSFLVVVWGVTVFKIILFLQCSPVLWWLLQHHALTNFLKINFVVSQNCICWNNKIARCIFYLVILSFS